jgi:MYXO-CTERM domain-containing protein
MLRWSVCHSYLVLILLVVVACSGSGGCSSGCAACGTTPLPAGFPQSSVITNAASVRVTRPGLDFIGANLGGVASNILKSTGGVVDFDIPSSTSMQTFVFVPVTIKICPNGPNPKSMPPQCIANIEIGMAKLHVDAITKDSIKISGTIPVRLQDLPVNVSLLGDMEVGVGNGQCNNGVPQFDYKDFPVDVELPLVAETLAPRTGYTKVDTKNAVINVNITSNDVAICKPCGLLQAVCDGIFGFIKGVAFNSLIGGVTGQLKTQLENQLCTKPDPTMMPACPTGTQPDAANAKCVFTSDPTTCVPTLLGLDGHMNLAKALAHLSPGTTGGVDFVLASGGDGTTPPDCGTNTTYDPTSMTCKPDPMPPYDGHTPNGLTLGMVGGMIPQPNSACVPQAEARLPMGIPIPDELMRDKQTPWPANDNGPDVGLALAGRFLDFAATSAYNSGVLCLGVSTEQFQAINTGLLSLLVPSLKDLTFEPGSSSPPAAVAITTRPQKPPVIKIGNGTDVNKDPLLGVSLPQFAMDFYVWSEDRYIRAFTYTSDLTIPINLSTGKDPKTNPNGGILPVLGNLGSANGVVTNSDLLQEQPATLAASVQNILSTVAGMFLGNGFKAIDVSTLLKSYGVGLTVPDGGFRKLTKGTDDFLGLFADLQSTPMMMMMRVHPSVRIVDQEVHPEAMGLFDADPAKTPKLHVALSAPEDDGTRAVEYSWWIDDQPHAAWTRERNVTVDSQALFLQGKHVLYASARVVGHPETEDDTPASAPYVIDVLAPSIAVKATDTGAAVHAYDFVSDASELTGRYRLAGANGQPGTWSDWLPLTALDGIATGEATSIDVQVQDAAKNIGTVVQPLIRGRPDPTLGSGSSCGCTVPGSSPDSRVGIVASLALLAMLGGLAVRRRRTTRSHAAVLAMSSLGVVAATTQGCACGSSPGATTGCGADCNSMCGTPGDPGLIGSYTSLATAPDGSLWVAGYDDADLTNSYLWGDLVVGKYDANAKQVQWVTVDGLPDLPSGQCAPNDPTSWRHGLTDAGPDVGLWTSTQVDSSGNVMVSYYDTTNKALKFASSKDGQSWSVHTVMQDPAKDIGRYSKMLLVGDKPVVGFLVMEAGTNGTAKSRLTLATAQSSPPKSPTDWSFQDAVVDDNEACQAQFCPTGQVCVVATGVCQATVTGCTASGMATDCSMTSSIGGAKQACVTVMNAATCSNIAQTSDVHTYPNAAADYISMAQGAQGLGIVVYDRTRGNLVGISNAGNKWTALILDGQMGANTDPMRVDTGDVGVGASLAIGGNGDWHVSYVNGFTEALQYLTVPGGDLTKPGKPEVVDDGIHGDGQPMGMSPINADGQHIMGDDSSITIDSSGNLRIVYQDATVGALREATGTPGMGGAYNWTAKVLSQPTVRFAGFFPHYVPQMSLVENWFRATDHTMNPVVVTGDVAFLSP